MKNKSNFLSTLIAVLLVVIFILVLAFLFGGVFFVYTQINKMFGRFKKYFFITILSLLISLAAFIVLIQRLTT